MSSGQPVSMRHVESRRQLRHDLLMLLWAVAAFAWPTRVGAETVEHVSELGPVTATVQIDPAESLVGDPVTLTLTVAAEQDVDVLMPEFGEALDRFAILDFVPRQTVDDQGHTVATQTYRLQIPFSGDHAIPPLLVEFVDQRPGQIVSPSGQDAYELLTERLRFTVNSVLPDDATADLHPPLGELPMRDLKPGSVGLAITASALAVLCLAGGGCGYLWWIHRRRVRRQTAYELASRRLERLLSQPSPVGDAIDEFFVELSDIVRHYLEDQFDLRAPELTTEEFLVSVSDSPDLNLDHQRLLREFLHDADLVKFSRFVPSHEDVEQAIGRTRQFLDETREDSSYLEVESDSVPVASAEMSTRGRK